MVFKEIFWYAGSFFAILLAIMKIFEKLPFLRKIYSKKPEIKISSLNYSFGCRIRSKKEKNALRGYSKKLPDIVPYFSLKLRLINISSRDNIVDLDMYIIKNKKEKLYLGRMENIVLKPMKKEKIEFKDLVFNFINEYYFWKDSGWEKLRNNEEIAHLFWETKLDSIYVNVEDAYSKKIILKLPLI